MNTRKLFRISALLVALIMLFTATMQTTMAFVVTKTDSIINIFLPFKGLVSDLILNKTVEHPFGDDYVYPDDVKFEFKVDLGTFYANTKIETSEGMVTTDKNGVLTVFVKPGAPVGIENLDEGTKVKVTEVTDSMGKGFAVKDGEDTKEAVIPSSGSVVIDITNIYTPDKTSAENVDLTGTKVLEGRDWQEGDTFSFLLEFKNKDGEWVDIGIETVTYDAENTDFNKFDFSDTIHSLEFSEAGTYSFRVSEIEGALDEIDYDKSVNHFNVVVGDPDMDGELDVVDVVVAQNITVTKDEANGMFAMEVVFNNTFVPEIKPIPEDVKVNLSVDKTVINKGEEEIGPEGFRFILEDTDGGKQIVLVSDKDGNANVELNFSAEDAGKTFNYKLHEKNEAKDHVTYDTNVYDISVEIILNEMDNVLETAITVNGKTAEAVECAFENIYDYTPPSAPPTGDSMITPIILFGASAAILVCLFVTRKKKSSIFE
ncbi:MAG: hypothetical protein IJ389_05555 [Clostridia bacterium]|nr:hypothetical protein [Clostridia bacterium]